MDSFFVAYIRSGSSEFTISPSPVYASFVDITALDDFDDVNAEFLCEVVVALVVCRNCHNCAGTVAHHYVVRNVNRNFPAVYGVYRGKTVNSDARLILDELSALELCLLCALLCGNDSIASAIAVILSLYLIDYRMLRSDYHKCNAEQSIAAGRVDAAASRRCLSTEKSDERARGLADPLLLL